MMERFIVVYSLKRNRRENDTLKVEHMKTTGHGHKVKATHDKFDSKRLRNVMCTEKIFAFAQKNQSMFSGEYFGTNLFDRGFRFSRLSLRAATDD